MTRTELEELIRSGENSGVEFKRDDIIRERLAKMRNVLDRLPQREQSEAKDLLRAVVYAPSRAEAVKAREVFARRYRPWYPKAVDVLEDDWERMVAFYDFPEDHSKHLRTTNVVESPFAALRLRTTAAKRFKRVESATALIWKLLLVADKRFRRHITDRSESRHQHGLNSWMVLWCQPLTTTSRLPNKGPLATARATVRGSLVAERKDSSGYVKVSAGNLWRELIDERSYAEELVSTVSKLVWKLICTMEYSPPFLSHFPWRQPPLVHYNTCNNLPATRSHDTALPRMDLKATIFYDGAHFLQILRGKSFFTGERQVICIARVGTVPII